MSADVVFTDGFWPDYTKQEAWVVVDCFLTGNGSDFLKLLAVTVVNCMLFEKKEWYEKIFMSAYAFSRSQDQLWAVIVVKQCDQRMSSIHFFGET